MNIIIYIFIGLSLAIIFLFFYMFARDKAIEKKFHLIGAALENINQEIYNIQKQQQQYKLQDIESMIAIQLEEVISNLIDNINQSQNQNQKEIEALFDKISQIEVNLKTLSLPNLESHTAKKDNKEKIRELYEIGYSIEEISKDMGIPAGEIQLLLKF